jgi:V/A-type H+/Na+-transporting ATPase subunit E
MTADSKLEETVNKILTQTETELLSSLKTSFDEASKNLSSSQFTLDQEYERIIDEGKKEAEKIEKQIIGSSDLESRNKQLLAVEKSVEKVFDNAIEKIRNVERNDNYTKLMQTLIDESINALGTKDVLVFTNQQDKDTIQSLLPKFPGAELSSETIDCLGGVEVKSKDGAMKFVNTINARLERMKPLIRKEIASKFKIGN